MEERAFQRFAACGDSGLAPVRICRQGEEVAGGAVHIDHHRELLALVVRQGRIVAALQKLAEGRLLRGAAWEGDASALIATAPA
ncbi:hypothetical protein RHAB21_02548 [Pseudorhizobium halotolerans]|uniref:Uncharacterized protein n=1 Tax=Pseudorhizobium halotolerans TaxID=1233081 RepID=A0ABM8PLK1_9HYPH|nr:hypothetical protein RHAB21_02548 [Pseudorhizobium halotolerans]